MLEMDALQLYVCDQSTKREEEEMEQLNEIRDGLKECIGGDYNYIDYYLNENTPLGKMVVENFKKKENRNQSTGLELLSLVDGNY